MPFLFKYWKAKALLVALTLAGTLGGWAALAWPDEPAAAPSGEQASDVGAALQYLAAIDSLQHPASAAPSRQVVVVTRPAAPREIVITVPEGQSAAAVELPVEPPPPAPAQARLPAPPPAAPSAPARAPSAPQAPAPAAPPPAPAPKKQPAPAPAVSKGS